MGHGLTAPLGRAFGTGILKVSTGLDERRGKYVR